MDTEAKAKERERCHGCRKGSRNFSPQKESKMELEDEKERKKEREREREMFFIQFLSHFETESKSKCSDLSSTPFISPKSLDIQLVEG